MQLETNMYFNNITETIDTIPRYFIDNLLEKSSLISTEDSFRMIVGKGNKIQDMYKMHVELIKPMIAISGYIYSQQYPILKNMVLHESMLMTPPPELTADTPQHSRYLNRIGELFLVPLTGEVKIATLDFPTPVILKPGNIYRINNRIGSRFYSSPDFLCAGFTFLDFDLKNYLMLHDLNSPFIRRKDEYADPSLAPEYLNKLSEKNAY